MSHTGYVFVPLHNPSNCLPTMGTTQEQALVTEQFRQDQDHFRRCTATDGALKNQITTLVQPVFLSPLVEQLTVFGQVTELQML